MTALWKKAWDASDATVAGQTWSERIAFSAGFLAGQGLDLLKNRILNKLGGGDATSAASK